MMFFNIGRKSGRLYDQVARLHHIVVLGAEGQFATELEVVLQRRGGAHRFVVASRPGLPGLDPSACALLIIDVDRPTGEGLELLTQCRKRYSHLPALALVRHGDTSATVAAMKTGAADCLEEPVEPGRLLSAVTAALGKQPSSKPQVCEPLTRAETRVLRLLLAGKTNAEMAEHFGRSRRTIEAHRRNIMRKLGVSHVSDLVRQAFRMQLIPGDTTDRESLP